MTRAEARWFADFAAALALGKAEGLTLEHARAEISRRRRVEELRGVALRVRERCAARIAA